jgi:hypothetical protein
VAEGKLAWLASFRKMLTLGERCVPLVFTSGRTGKQAATDDVHRVSKRLVFSSSEIPLRLKRHDICHVQRMMLSTVATRVFNR